MSTDHLDSRTKIKEEQNQNLQNSSRCADLPIGRTRAAERGASRRPGPPTSPLPPPPPPPPPLSRGKPLRAPPPAESAPAYRRSTARHSSGVRGGAGQLRRGRARPESPEMPPALRRPSARRNGLCSRSYWAGPRQD